MSRRRTAVCTIATGPHVDLYEIARPGLEAFCRFHGHDLVAVQHDVSGGRPTSWGKLPLLRELLEVYDLVAWVDADAIIVDPRGDIFEHVNHRISMRVVVHRYDGLEIPNLGVMAFASTAWSKRFLSRLWNSEEFIDHKWWENAAALRLLGYDVDYPRRETRRFRVASIRVGELDNSWNSISQDPAVHPRIRHFPGMTQADRLVEMRRAADSAVGESLDLPTGPERRPYRVDGATGNVGLAILTGDVQRHD